MDRLEKAIYISSMEVYIKKVANPTNNCEIRRGAIFLYQTSKNLLKERVNLEELKQLDEKMCSATSSWDYCSIIDRTT